MTKLVKQMRLGLLVAAVGLGLGASSAQAQTTIVAPPESHHAYQRWVDEARVPTPSVTLTVIEERCPDNVSWACTVSGTYIIWAAPASTEQVFLHELGHNFDFYDLPEWARERFEFLVEDSRPWGEGPNENFAEAYAACAVSGPRFYGNPLMFVKGNGAGIRQVTYRAICRMIISVGASQ